MAKYSSKELKKINKDYKKMFKESGCRLLSEDEMQNVSDSMKMLDSSDVKIIKNAQNGNYAEFNDASALVRNYVGTLSLRKMVEETGVAQDQLSLSNPQVKKYVQDHILDAGFRTGLAALKHTFPANANFKALDEYSNEYMLAQTLAVPTQAKVDALRNSLGASNADRELQKNLSKQVVLAKTLFLAQLGQYNMKENGANVEYKGSIAETFAHGGRTNFILPHNDVNNEVLAAFDGGEIAKNAEFKSRMAATHSATQRKLNADLSIAEESKEEKPKFSEVGKIFSNQYGMDVAVGGIGEMGPNQKPVLADGSAGHMYIRKQKGNENTCGSLMVGIESAASLKTSHTGHFHTPLAKSSKQSAFLSDKFGPGDKTDGKTVDLSGLDASKLASVLKEFENGYMALQNSSNSKALNQVNELLSGKRMQEAELVSLMTNTLGMKKDFVMEVVGDARKGLEGRVQREKENLSKQFKNVLGVDLNTSATAESVKVMQKNANGKWELSNLFSANDTPDQRFSKFKQAVHNGGELYLSSNTNKSPTKINVQNNSLSIGENVEKLNLADPIEPSGFKKTLHNLTRGLLFSSAIKQYEQNKQNFEKQQELNAMVEAHDVNYKAYVQKNPTYSPEQSILSKMLKESLRSPEVGKSEPVEHDVSKGIGLGLK